MINKVIIMRDMTEMDIEKTVSTKRVPIGTAMTDRDLTSAAMTVMAIIVTAIT